MARWHSRQEGETDGKRRNRLTSDAREETLLFHQRTLQYVLKKDGVWGGSEAFCDALIGGTKQGRGGLRLKPLATCAQMCDSKGALRGVNAGAAAAAAIHLERIRQGWTGWEGSVIGQTQVHRLEGVGCHQKADGQQRWNCQEGEQIHGFSNLRTIFVRRGDGTARTAFGAAFRADWERTDSCRLCFAQV